MSKKVTIVNAKGKEVSKTKDEWDQMSKWQKSKGKELWKLKESKKKNEE